MKGKRGRPAIPFSNLSNRKQSGLTGTAPPSSDGDSQLARGGASKNRLDKKARGGKTGWIKSAIKHPGAEKKAAAKAGMSTHAYMEEHKHDSGKSGARARLGLTLSRMSKNKK